MRIRYLFFAALFACTVPAGGCRGKHQRTTVQNEEPQDAAPRIQSAVKMSDPGAQAQLVKGVYGLESGTWRWTAAHFSILLRTPPLAAQRGATLALALTVPDVISQKLGPVTLTASSGGTKLKSEIYPKSGSYTFSADVPGALLGKESVVFDFELDKSISPTASDSRELGLIVSATSLESK